MKAITLFFTTVALSLGSAALAADPAPMGKSTAKPATVAAAKPSARPARTVGANSASKPRTAISIDCSKQADAKGLHGKEREKFRAACKKGK